MPTPIQIFHADRFYLLRKGVKFMLEQQANNFQIVGDADTFASLFFQLRGWQPAILMISHKLLDGLTIDHIEGIRKKYPKLKIIIFTLECSVENLLQFIGKVDGFISKLGSEEELKEAIIEVAKGNSFLTVNCS